MHILIFLELFLSSLVAATINVQPIISSNERWLRVVYQSENNITLRVSKDVNSIEFTLDAKKELKEISLPLPYQGSDEIKIEALEKKHKLSFPFLSISPTLKLSPKKLHNQLGTRLGNGWIIPKGTYQISGHHEITQEQIKVQPGTEFHFQPQSSLIFRGQTSLIGTKEAPIIFKGVNNKSDYFIQILQNENDLSHIKHVTISTNAHALDKLPTGTLTLHGGSFLIAHLFMHDLESEDGLNLIQSSATMNQSQFKNLSSDAIDCDFCSLEVTNLNFEKIKGDGIDLSGASLKAQDTEMTHIQDKGFSIGENSRAQLTRIKVLQSQIGAAIKDASLAKIEGYNFEGTKTPITLYTKKMWFSTPPELHLSPPYPNKKDFVILNKAKLIEESPDEI